MTQQSTLKKLSEVLGISISTVSRALKDHPDISESTKTKVKELATALEYEPNNYAVQLRTRQSNVLGILVPVIDNFFYDSFIAAVEEDARVHGYSVMIMQSRDKLPTELSSLHHFRKNMVMGLFAAVSVDTEDMAAYHKLEEMKIPVVFFDRVPETEGYHKVCLADEDAARIAADAIIEKKKKRVLALFGHSHLSISKRRHASLVSCFEQRAPKTKLNVHFVEGNTETERVTLDAFRGKSKPDVIFCMGDLHLIGAMQAIHKMKLRVPEDVAVISISNGFIPTLFNPRITYVETSGFKLGKLAFHQMLSRLRNDTTPELVTLSSVLVPGGSI